MDEYRPRSGSRIVRFYGDQPVEPLNHPGTTRRSPQGAVMRASVALGGIGPWGNPVGAIVVCYRAA